MSNKKLYAVGCYTPEDWTYIHEVLTKDGTLEDNIPERDVLCADLKDHSETRAVYLLDETEAEELKNHPKVKFVNINYSSYRDEFMPPPEELYSTPRYPQTVKNYRNFYDTNTLPTTPTSADINRSGYQLLRCQGKSNPWQGVGITSATVINSNIEYTNDGTDVDVIVGDDGMWFGHVEFQNNIGSGPTNYRGGNVLPGNGTCDLLDLVLDAPYYIDPDWFNALPGSRLTTRWDGTTVPVESVARSWWTNSSARSSQFAGIGVISSIPSTYTRAYCNGTNTQISSVGDHGTPCCALTYGRTQGWAFNANKWALNVYNINGIDIEPYFDMMKLFHLNKPINPKYGNRNPTISSNSWGYRSTSHRGGGTTIDYFYYYRQGASGGIGTAYRTNTMPGFMNYVGLYGDGYRMKGEHPDNSMIEAGKEMIDSGVIFVAAAGNSNQKQVSSDHPDFNNYWALANGTSLTSATHSEFGITAYNTTNRRGFPQQLGKYTENNEVIYPTINIGALDDSYMNNGKEKKVDYSDMGNEIDCYAPADGTLAAQWATSGGYKLRYDTYSIFNFYDNKFSGTSSACPVATGLIATLLQTNRNWTWRDVKNYLRQNLEPQDTNYFYTGVESTTANASSWSDVNSLEGGDPIVIYNASVSYSIPRFMTGSGLKLSGNGLKFFT
jgi:hypothetical protein